MVECVGMYLRVFNNYVQTINLSKGPLTILGVSAHCNIEHKMHRDNNIHSTFTILILKMLLDNRG